MQKIRQRFDPSAMETGSDNRDELSDENQQAEVVADKNARRLARQQAQKEAVSKDQVNASGRAAESQEEERLAVTEFLSEDDQQALRAVFGSDDQQLSEVIDELDAADESAAEPQNADGLAIALQASAADDDFEERAVNPAAEKHYGDNLSLEGATNSQTYARLWLEARMKEGADNQDKREEQRVEGMESERHSDDSLADLLQELQNVPLDVADALEEQQEASSVISKSRRI